MDDAGAIAELAKDAGELTVIPIDAYTSEAYARAENEKLWGKVWQAACRVEEIPKVGDYVTYDILDESIIVVRTAEDRIQAFYNVCQHRGRRLTEGCGHAKQFFCRFHGWRWNIDGENSFILDQQDWGGVLTPENTRLKSVKADTWGGWVWINMDPDCIPLREYLEPAASMLDPFELEKMRYRWRQWLYFPANWKVALEAFNESYHVRTTHPHLLQWGMTSRFWCKAQGKHSWHGPGASTGPGRAGASNANGGAAQPPGMDPRKSVAEFMRTLLETVDATTTDTLVRAAERLVDEVPEGAPPHEVMTHLMVSARRDDAARGVIWPDITPEHMQATGIDWQVFPNTLILHGITFALCYRARPNGYDPNSCIFEVYVLERYPEGEEPKTEWTFVPDPEDERWPLVLKQDFQNMPEVQRGVKSRGFMGARPGPLQELPVYYFHKLLSEYMDGVGAPEPIA